MISLIAHTARWKALILLNAIYAAAGLLWIILIPYNNAPDENTHFHYSVEFILQHRRLPVWGVDDLERFRHALSSYNQMPALNYILYALGAAAGKKLFGLETYLAARFVSLIWGLVFLNFLFLAVRELCANEKNALIISAAFALIPQVLFSFCYVNADAHSLAISAMLAYALTRLLRSQTTLSIIFAGAAIGLLLSARYNYYIYLPSIAVLLLLGIINRTFSWKVIFKLIIASAAMSLLISGYWFIRNFLLYGNPIPLLLSEDFFRSISLAREIYPVKRGLNIPALIWLVQQGFISSTFNSFFAVFGYLNVGFHKGIYIILQLFVPLIAFLFILDLMLTPDRIARIMFAWLSALIFAVMALHVWACLTYDYQPQGRYQFAVLIPIALYAAWALRRQTSLWKHAVFFLIIMVCLFIGANILMARTYAPSVQFSVSWSGEGKPRGTMRPRSAEARLREGESAWQARGKPREARDKSFNSSKCITQKAKRTEKNYYSTGNIPLGNESIFCLRVDFPEDFLARYRDLKLELETDEGILTPELNVIPPEQIINAAFIKQLNAFEVCGYNSYFILPLEDMTAKVKSVKISCRIENRRLYDLEK